MAENTLDFLVCNTCGTQYSTTSRADLKSCRTCDDPRQYVPRTGQTFTTLADLKNSNKYINEFTKVDDKDDRFWSIRTEPPLAISQRAILIKTPQGNVLWDCITYLDEETVSRVNSQGGLSAIVISHPHYYSTVSSQLLLGIPCVCSNVLRNSSILSGPKSSTAQSTWQMKTRHG